ncbi:hypothetical protein BEP19_07935 [Ammoniphilus oxalaticus]|uniref:Uncharacterized protein n=1 Tax=Ammoniphilus oxalaticus TaxID=66863 RepID=A0A419SK88_9BACL|nr:hypothetical protein [Ammoniphilus oxalaticus]RKD24318.1 hypothetical protein BEP19_07935 [Ammoniphilus oxalaticus]
MVLFAIVVSLLSFLLVGVMGIFKHYLGNSEMSLSEHRFIDRLNKEKYLEEVGYNVMNDPW